LKRFLNKSFSIAAAMALFISLVLLHGSIVRAEIWSFVDGNGSTGINYDTTKAAFAPKTAVLNGTLYAVWSESNGTNTQIRVKKYDNGTWVTADNNTPLNKDANKNATLPTIAVFNNELYVAWEEVSSMWQVRVSKLVGTTWISVDGDGVNGININSNDNAKFTKLIIFKNELYCFWSEASGSVRVKKYGGGSTWNTFAGGSPLNKDSSKAGQNAEVAVHNNKLYATWSENTSSGGAVVWVKVYDSSTWKFVDGIPGTGLNIDSGKWASIPTLASYNNELYVAWSEDNLIRVKKFNDVTSTWDLIDEGGISYTSNFPNTSLPRMTVFDDKLYMIWKEGSSPGRMHVKQYDGAWSWIDGNTAQGLNKDASRSANYGYLFEYDNSLNAIFYETDGTADQIRVTQLGPSNYKPTATDVSFTGTLKEGKTLTGTYTYGDTETDLEGITTFKWYTATDAAGTGKTAISGATTTTLNLTSAETGKYIIFEVTPVAETGTLIGTPVTYTSDSTVLANSVPAANNVTISGSLMLNQTLSGSYTYADSDSDGEAGTTFQWYTADNVVGTNKTAISGATTKTLTLKAEQYGKFLIFEVTPAAASGNTPGVAASSSAYGAVGVLKGDANGDGIITPADALYATRAAQGKLTLTDEQIKALDMDGDGDVDTDDAELILNIYLGKGV
jgi:hypothetical protein